MQLAAGRILPAPAAILILTLLPAMDAQVLHHRPAAQPAPPAAHLARPSLVARPSQSVTIRAGVPLRIEIDHHYRVRAGTHIEGHLIAPVDSIDHSVLPVNTRVTGTILGMRRDPQQSRVRALLNGQFTAPAVPAVRFDSLQLPSGATIAIHTSVTERDASVVTMSTRKKKSGLRARAHSIVQAKKHGILDIIRHPNGGDRIRKLIYSQLPWYPPTLWSGTQYDAELTAPLTIPGSQPAPLPDAILHGTPTGTINARLLTPLSSATDHRGAQVVAILTRPLLTPDGKQVIFPEGARMTGTVAISRRARWFARNGQLRFTFRSIEERGHASPTIIHGQLAAAETAPGTRVKINQEGEAKSSSGPGKYLAPMALGAMTASALDSDATSNPMHSGTATNSFGFAARTAVMVSANAALLHVLAIYAVSMSIYNRWIARGHEVSFPKDTRVQILLNQR